MAALDQLRHLAVEEGDQQRGDVGAVDVGVGHDDDLLVAQILVAVVRAGAAAERLHQIGELLRSAPACPCRRTATLRILPRSGSTACEARSRACLAEPPALVALDDEDLRALRPAVLVQSASLPGRRSLRTAVLREMSFSWRRRMRSSARSTTKSSSLLACVRIAGEPMVERVLDRVLDDALRLGGGEAVLGLALEFRLADEHRQHAAGADHHVFAGDRRRRACPGRRARRGPSARAAARCASRTSWVPPSGVGMVLQ